MVERVKGSLEERVRSVNQAFKDEKVLDGLDWLTFFSIKAIGIGCGDIVNMVWTD